MIAGSKKHILPTALSFLSLRWIHSGTKNATFLEIKHSSQNQDLQFQGQSNQNLNHRFSLLLRLHNFILKLQLKSGSTVSISTHQKRTFKSTLFSLLDKLRLRRANKTFTIQNPDLKSLLNPFANKESNSGGSLVAAIIALLLQSTFKEDRQGIITLISLILLYWMLYFEKHLRGKTRSFWMVLIAGTAGSWVAFNLGKDYVSNYAWNWIEWSYGYTVFSGFWYVAWKVIFAIVKTIFYFPKLRRKYWL